MTREEAIEILKNNTGMLYDLMTKADIIQAPLYQKAAVQALSILAPTPRTEPLPIGDVVWLWDEFMCAWCLSRIAMHGSPFAIWLPESALPKVGA